MAEEALSTCFERAYIFYKNCFQQCSKSTTFASNWQNSKDNGNIGTRFCKSGKRA